ncbi:MAG TPA: hypothetical protein ENI17_07495 [Pseudomonas xinjiangensis]|uniref:Uncharacterized protein n=1 Tax=Halopseudomonas xinjiangensis TaxID=487184 RepID=A0A7V1BND0_9GAMM|nr:hypothetical protein [Halopseudomonas xinjiangensis]HEC47458.1 hypothetical protein [Halopseudomonas xinjiangensis]
MNGIYLRSEIGFPWDRPTLSLIFKAFSQRRTLDIALMSWGKRRSAWVGVKSKQSLPNRAAKTFFLLLERIRTSVFTAMRSCMERLNSPNGRIVTKFTARASVRKRVSGWTSSTSSLPASLLHPSFNTSTPSHFSEAGGVTRASPLDGGRLEIEYLAGQQTWTKGAR